ncbi:hypothetical protein A9Q78_05320 [Methylophaga sp. 41_12_T18]|nr:hypothetical protein A9Q78_05320 [Methylophaga sp. 41_12_T18]
MTSLLKPDVAALVLRLSLGSVLLAHSVYLKLMVFTLAGTAGYFESIGLPGGLAYFVFLAEAIGGIAIILGVKTRLFAALVIPVLIGATWAHSANGWVFSSAGGGWEFPLFLVAIAVVQVTIGSGKFALAADARS